MNKKGMAIITGGSRGIGYHLAKGLMEDGYQLLLLARNEKRLQAVCEEIAQCFPQYPEPEYAVVDVTDREKVSEIVSETDSREAQISILINNAGIWMDGTLDHSVEDFSHLLNVNLLAPFHLMKEVGRRMKRQEFGYIFNIASRAGKYGFPGSGLYSASKFGLAGLSESLYREYGKFGVKVTTICPGWVDTDMAYEANTPYEGKEMIQPQDILTAVRFLLQLSAPACIKELILESTKSTL